jgi:hypothetical protein
MSPRSSSKDSLIAEPKLPQAYWAHCPAAMKQCDRHQTAPMYFWLPWELAIIHRKII